MYSRTTLGNYYPVNSLIHKLNPTNKIFCLILFILFLIFSMSLKIHFIILGFIVLCVLISKVPFRFYFNIIFSKRYLLLFIFFAMLLSRFSLEVTIVVTLKIVMFLLIVSMLTFTTSPSELAYGIEKNIYPFNIFNINFSKLINKLVNLIRFFPILITNEYKVLKAVDSKGMNYSYNNMLERFFIRKKMFGSSFVITRRNMKNIKEEANLRMYSYKKYRTNYRVNNFGFFDLIYLLIFLMIIVLEFYERGLLNAILTRITL